MKMEFTSGDVDSILCKFAEIEYVKKTLDNIDYQSQDWMEFRNKFLQTFKSNYPELFGYVYDENQGDWVQDRTQGDFEEDWI